MLILVIIQIVLLTNGVNIVKNEVKVLLSVSTKNYEWAIMNNKRYKYIGKRCVKYKGMIEDSIDEKRWKKIIRKINALKNLDLKNKELSKIVRIDDKCYNINILLNENIDKIFVCRGNDKASEVIRYIHDIMNDLHLYDKYIGKKFYPAKLLNTWKCPITISKKDQDEITVIIWLIVSKEGSVKEIKNLSSNNKKLLIKYEDNIKKCAKNLKFRPAFIDNVPIESDFLLTIRWNNHEQNDAYNKNQ